MKIRALFAFFIISLAGILMTCLNPLESGLGPKPDIQPPQLSVTSHSNGDYVKDSIILSGTAADDIQINTVQLSLDDRVSWVNATVDTVAKTWSYNIDTTTYADKRYNIIIKAMDASKETETGILLIFDNTPPLVLVKVPSVYIGAKFNGTVSIKGETTDEFGISLVQVRVLKMDNTVVQDWTTALGTASWSYNFNSGSLDEDIKVEVRAIDYANNTSTYFFHYTDVLAANGSVPITIEQINEVNKTGTGILGLTKTELDAIRKPNPGLLTLTIDQDSDLPQIIISSPQENDILGADARAIGIASDDDGVPVTVTINIDGTGWNTVTPVSYGENSLNWTYDLSSIAPGSHTLQVRAVDIGSVENTTAAVPFSINIGAPSIEITTPAQGSFKSTDFTIRGTATHGSTIESVEVSTDGGTSWSNATLEDSFVHWYKDIDTSGLADGPHTIKVRATAGGNTAYANLQINMATIPPTINFIVPSSGSSVNGTIIIQGTTSVTGATLETLGLKIQKSGTTLTTSGSPYFWSVNFDSTVYDNIDNADELAPAGSNKWQITLVATAIDSAGNIGTSNHTFIIDQSTDWPVPALTFPASVSAPYEIVGANTVIRGTVTDDEGVNNSTVAVSVDGAAYTSTGVIVTGSGTNVSFTYTMPTVADGQHTVRVRANDTVASGLRESSLVTFIVDTQVPSFTNILPVQRSYRNADFVVSGRTFDVNNISAVSVSVNGGAYEAADTLVPVGNEQTKDFTKTISTASGSGTYVINIKATDATGKEAPYTLEIIVDKTNPSVVFTNPSVAGTHITGTLDIKGTSSDNNLVSSVAVKIVEPDLDLFDLGATGTYNWLVSGFTVGTYTNTTYAANNGNGTWTLTLRAIVSDTAGNSVSTDLSVILDPALNNPVITLTNINLAGTTILESNPKILGYITDNNGVDIMEIDLDGTGYASMGDPLNALNAPFSVDVNALADGQHTLQIRATDVSVPPVITTTASINFRIDRTAPTLTLTAPVSNSQQNANFNVTGTSDDLNGVTSVQVKVDTGTFQNASYTSPNWTYNVNITGLSEGVHTLTIQSTDLSGKTTTMSRDFIKDTLGPSIAVTDPVVGTEQIGAVIIKGTTSDANAITAVSLAIGAPQSYQPVTGIYNWTYVIDNIDIYADAGFAELIDTDPYNVWRLYIRIRATDAAGNIFTKENYYVDLVPEKNRPDVAIVYPIDNQTLGGQLRIYGTAVSLKNSVSTVQMQIDYNADGDYLDAENFWDGSSPNPDSDTSDLWETESTWVTITGTGNWSQTINTFGEFYSKTPGETKTIKFRIKAIDSMANESTPVERTITFTNNVPMVENLQIEYAGKLEAYNSGIITSKTIVIRGIVKDSHGVDSIMLTRLVPSGTAADIIADPAKVTPNGIVGGYDQYTLHITVNTEDTGLYPGSAGQLSYSIRVTNDAEPNPYITYANLNLQVDNIYPGGAFTGSSDVANYAYKAEGTATDSGPVSGVEKVVVYMVRDESGTKYVYNPKLNDTRTLLATTKQLKDGGSVTNVLYPEPSSATSVYRISIDSSTEYGDDTANNPGAVPPQVGDNDGYDESFRLSGSTYLWWAEFDSYNIPDGPIEIHYVVFDKGGNGTHYMQSGFVKNHPPVVTQITLGTDLNGNGTTIDSGESEPFTSGYSATNFTARNSRLRFNITATGGNGALHYSIKYNNTLEQGVNPYTANEITISNFSDPNLIPDASGNGASFTVRVYDETPGGSLEQIITVNMNIANTDTVPPTVTLAALATTDATSDPLTGGHIELLNESAFDGLDPDVSGTVTLRGHAHDDQRVQYLKMTITNYNLGAGSGVEATLATWPQTNTSGTYGNLTISNVTLTQSGGHDFDWVYIWNTANVQYQANTNISVTVKAEDFQPNSNVVPASRTHDIVPYITGLLRSVGAEGTIRSKYGKYTIQQSETGLIINGFNLSKAGPGTRWMRITNTGGTLFETVPDANVAANGTYTAMTISSFGGAISYSGFLSVMVNGVESSNNVNDNTKTYNKENDGHGIPATLWNDNRYVDVWRTGASFYQTSNANYPSMSIDSSGTLYGAWTDYTTAASVFYGTTTANTAIFQMYDPAEFTDIHVDGTNITVAFLGNYYGGSGWDNNISTAGSMNVWNASAPQQVRRGAGYPWNFFYRFEMLYHNQMLLQFQRPKVVRTGNNIHLAYYDISESPNYPSVKYGYALNGDTDTAEKAWINIDGGSDGDDTQLVTNGVARSASAGEYVAVDVDEQGYPVIVYYDTANQTLKLARATSLTPNTAANWVRQDVFKTDDPNRSLVGKYPTIKFDTAGKLYVVCYRVSTGDLIYLEAPNVTVGNNYVFGYSTIIDSEGAVGTWADITLNNTTPYVSYINNSMSGTFSGLKMAYYDVSRSAWEYEIVPAATAVMENRTNIEYKKGTVDWTVSIGYKGNAFDIVQLKPEQ